jgi:hypothetical protein
MDKAASEDTRLLYCTTGVLLKKLIAEKNMHKFTHVILDEVWLQMFRVILLLLGTIARVQLLFISKDVWYTIALPGKTSSKVEQL